MNRLIFPVFLALSSLLCSAQSFQNPRSISVDGNADAVSVADLNNDGLLDLIVGVGSNIASLRIETFLADQKGNYTLAGQINLPSGASYLCKPVDLNGDKKIDLACPGQPTPNGNGVVLVYLGNGDGTFQAPISTPLAGLFSQSSTITAAADMNGDGHIDLIATAGTGSANYMLLGDGTGHFTVSKFLGNDVTTNATVADVNGDGIPDLLAGGGAIFLGKGDGTFSTSYPTQYLSCIYADFERRSRLSAACATPTSTLTFYHLNSDGSFNANPIGSVSFTGSAQFTGALRALDLNGDGILDLLLTSNDGLQVAMGKPGLTFTTPVPYDAGTTTTPNYVTGTFSDMDGDGHPDFVSTGPHNVYISYGTASGAFNAPVLNIVGTNLITSTTADFNGDGFPDVLTIGLPGINFLQGKGDGTLAAPVPVSLPSGYAITPGTDPIFGDRLLTGDFNGDGKKDFLMPVGVFFSNIMFLGNGDGSFALAIVVSPQTLPNTITAAAPVVADVNGDRKDDIVQMQPTSINAYLSQGDGTFRLVSSQFLNNNGYNTAVAFSDLNGDGILDAVVSFAGSAIVLTGKGDGSFIATNTTLTVPTIPGVTLQTNVIPLIAFGDFDGDGKTDVALMGQYVSPGTIYTTQFASALWVYYGNGDTTFSQPVSAAQFLDNNYSHLAAGVLTLSGRSDLVLAGNTLSSPVASPLAVVTSLAGRSFRAPAYLVGGEQIDSIYLADFNHDGKLDLMLSNGYDYIVNSDYENSVTVLLNQGSLIKETLTTTPQASFAGNSYTVTATLTPPGSQTTPLAGNVNFTLDGVSIGSAPLANNVATQTISTNVTVGNHNLSASWAGDATYWPVTVTATHSISDFTLTSDSTVTIQTQHQSPVAIRLTSLNGFTDDLTLSCENLPANASCTFANAAPHLSGNQTIDSQLTIDTGSAVACLGRPDGFFGQLRGIPALAMLVPGCLLVLVRRRIRPGLIVCIAALALMTSIGCGGKGKGVVAPPVVPPHTLPGTYTVSVIARGANSQVSHTTLVTLTVTP